VKHPTANIQRLTSNDARALTIERSMFDVGCSMFSYSQISSCGRS
jgi:hypothetical protein